MTFPTHTAETPKSITQTGSESTMLLRIGFAALFLCWLCFALWSDYSKLTATEITLHFLFFLYFGMMARLFKALDFSGVLAACMIGTQLCAVGNFSIQPILFFFITGSALSRLRKKGQSDAKAGKPRDFIQVLSNGGPAFLISAIGSYIGSDLEVLYLVSIAIATADTWASEIGMAYGKNTRDIFSAKAVPTGLSGGVTNIGLLAGAGGALCIALFANSWTAVALVFLAGMLGSLLDSALGSKLQAAYINRIGVMSDQENGTVVKGLRWMNNDLVNLTSNVITTLIFAIILL